MRTKRKVAKNHRVFHVLPLHSLTWLRTECLKITLQDRRRRRLQLRNKRDATKFDHLCRIITPRYIKKNKNKIKKKKEDKKDTRRRERNKASERTRERERRKNGGDATEAEVGNHSSMHEVTEICNV